MSRQKTDHIAFASADAKLCEAFFDMLCLTGGHAAAGEVLSVHLISPNLCFFTKAPYYPNSFCQKPFLSFSVYLISFINSYLSNAGFNRSGIVTLVRL